MIEIKQILEKEEYMNLLLEADPDKNMVMQYLNNSEMYGLFNNDEIMAEIVIKRISEDICELKNIATVKFERGKGYAKQLIKYIANLYKSKYKMMIVGTTENNIPFYVKCGFDRYYKTIKDFFINNYEEEIYDGSLHCIDMYYYSMNLPENFEIERINKFTRKTANEILKNEWESTDIIVRGNIIDGTKLDGFFAIDDYGAIIGLITYIVYDNKECEIISLNSFIENIGIGTKLIEKVKELAKQKKCNVIKLMTTNDNVNALKFYQKNGFSISDIYYNAMEKSREIKPKIPIYADNGIRIKDEIELKMKLS